MVLVELVLVFLNIGLLSIGGGYATLPYIQSIIVEQKGWLDMSMYTDLLTISQMTPGPFGINAASFVGMKVAGPIGAILATVAFVLPSLVIVLVVSIFYYKYKRLTGVDLLMRAIRPVVVSLIASVAYGLVTLLFVGERVVVRVFLFASCFIVLRYIKINPIILIIISGLVNVGVYLLEKFLFYK